MEIGDNSGIFTYKATARTKKEKSGKRRRIRIFCELFLFTLIIAAVGAMLFWTKREYTASERDLKENYWTRVAEQPDGSVVVSGKNGDKEYSYVEDWRILDGVSINGIELGGMDYEQARQILLDSIDETVRKLNMRAGVDGRSVLLTAADLKVSTDQDVNALIGKALMVGRGEDKSYYENYLERKSIAENGVDIGSFSLVLDEASVNYAVERIAAIVDTTPEEPYITIRSKIGGTRPDAGMGGSGADLYSTQTVKAPNGVELAEIQFHSGVKGRVLNKEDLADQIKNAFYSGNYELELELLLEETDPQTDIEVLATSFTELSRFSTRFVSSSTARARNVQKAAGLLHCTIMEPGGEYSYNDLLGPRFESDGWLPAHAIAGGEYIDSPGGGICQVSTTLYNALLRTGPRFRIIKRRPHSIPGSYIDMGLDATVSYGGPDLVWRNEHDTPMLLFSYADMNTRTVYEIIYGIPDEVQYKYNVWSETVETIEPGEARRVEEKLWPTGYSKMTIKPRRGYKVNVYRQKLDMEGNEIGEPELLYQDTYRAENGELHYGTGPTSLPKPE